MKKNQPKQTLASLKKEWYDKLKSEGFNDIEVDETRLKTWSYSMSRVAYKYKDMMFNSKTDYYRLSEHFLNEFKFESELDKVVWEYHTNGVSRKNIVKILNQLPDKNKHTTLAKIRYWLDKLKQKMFRLYEVHAGKPNEQ